MVKIYTAHIHITAYTAEVAISLMEEALNNMKNGYERGGTPLGDGKSGLKSYGACSMHGTDGEDNINFHPTMTCHFDEDIDELIPTPKDTKWISRLGGVRNNAGWFGS